MKQKIAKFKYKFIQSLIKEITDEIKAGDVSEESMLGWYLIKHDFPKECESALKKVPKSKQNEFIGEIGKRQKVFDEMKKELVGSEALIPQQEEEREESDVDYIG